MDPYPPYGPGRVTGPARATGEGKAVVALVLGLTSLFLCGLTGIPAMLVGFSARADATRAASEGYPSQGRGMATAGIVVGALGTLTSVASIALFLFGFAFTTHLASLFGGSGSAATASPVPYSTPSAPTSPGGGHTGPIASPMLDPSLTPRHSSPLVNGKIGAVRVLDLDPSAQTSFQEQLAREVKRARAAKQVPLVMTSATWCTVCREFEDAMLDPRMQSALAKVALVRVDIDAFESELRERGMFEPTLPWFYKVDASLRAVDAISAGEWDENVPANMAPVLTSFVGGTLRARRQPSSLGTSL